jgi:hypothetical protein
VMDQLGHTDPTFTFRVYRHSMRRDQESRQQLRELVGVEATGSDRAFIGQRLGSSRDFEAGEAVDGLVPTTKNPRVSRDFR